jgi:hypothetical protein
MPVLVEVFAFQKLQDHPALFLKRVSLMCRSLWNSTAWCGDGQACKYIENVVNKPLIY